jgi:CRP-like cAMP-binding protein
MGTGLAQLVSCSTAIPTTINASHRLRVNRSISNMTVSDVTTRCRAEFAEMPGLRLTLPQAARFLGIDVRTCERALEQLVDSGFLRKTDSAYMRIGVVRD